MKNRRFQPAARRICFLMIFGIVNIARAETVYYSLDNVILDDGTQMFGLISWSYTAGDFENGVRQFIFLTIPHSSHNQEDLITTIEPSQTEITFEGNAHDDGVDIKLVLQPPLTPDTSSLVNTNKTTSKYSIGGNGFHDGVFVSGSITLTNLILSITPDTPGFVALSWVPEIPGSMLFRKNRFSPPTGWIPLAAPTTPRLSPSQLRLCSIGWSYPRRAGTIPFRL